MWVDTLDTEDLDCCAGETALRDGGGSFHEQYDRFFSSQKRRGTNGLLPVRLRSGLQWSGAGFGGGED